MNPEYLVIYLRAHWWGLNIHLTYVLEATWIYTVQMYLNELEYILHKCTKNKLNIYLTSNTEYLVIYHREHWIYTLQMYLNNP